MKLARLILFSLIASALITSAQNASSHDRIRVAFWNIQWFPGRHPDAAPSAERAQINSVLADFHQIDADVVGLEEVRDFDKAGVAVSPLANFKVDVCADFPPRENQNVAQQVALTSRLPALSAWSEMWQAHGPMTPPRGFAFAAYTIAPQKLLLVYALHLKSNRGEIAEDIAIREEAMRQLCAHMDAMENAYGKLGEITWIVGGDFNTAPDDPRFATEKTTHLLTARGFSWCWQNVPAADRITLPPDKRFPAACFDHIFYRNAKLLSARVIPTSPQSSDHRAVWAELEY
ncbi:MAG: endonuclease/exonuclease/phosphatase family protein [Verrucomicrobiota bacterium]|nr:endonuclease/exonuclease/phosphatase family protein [Verrucomicrobiota bacterium]